MQGRNVNLLETEGGDQKPRRSHQDLTRFHRLVLLLIPQFGMPDDRPGEIFPLRTDPFQRSQQFPRLLLLPPDLA
jgi:hypothetical protein